MQLRSPARLSECINRQKSPPLARDHVLPSPEVPLLRVTEDIAHVGQRHPLQKLKPIPHPRQHLEHSPPRTPLLIFQYGMQKFEFLKKMFLFTFRDRERMCERWWGGGTKGRGDTSNRLCAGLGPPRGFRLIPGPEIVT